MFNKIFKKVVVPTEGNDELLAYESWSVRWVSRKIWGTSSDSDLTTRKLESEVFTNQDDANRFSDELKRAMSVLRFDIKLLNITIERKYNHRKKCLK
jgi:hypothetical protein